MIKRSMSPASAPMREWHSCNRITKGHSRCLRDAVTCLLLPSQIAARHEDERMLRIRRAVKAHDAVAHPLYLLFHLRSHSRAGSVYYAHADS